MIPLESLFSFAGVNDVSTEILIELPTGGETREAEQKWI